MTSPTIDPATVTKWKAIRDHRLKLQAGQLMAVSLTQVTCSCRATIPLFKACRCPECALYFCEPCAREHIPEHITRRVDSLDTTTLNGHGKPRLQSADSL